MGTLMILADAAHGHAAEDASLWEEYLALLTSIPHVALELTVEAVTGSIAYFLGWRRAKRKAIREHDLKYHPHEHALAHGECA